MTTHNINDLPLYGEYNWDDPIYKVLRRETASPRYKIYLMQQGRLNLVFYQYTDMLALNSRAGVDFDGLFRKQRRMLVDDKIETESNQEMHANFTQTQTPYSDLEEEDWRYGSVWCG